MKKSIIAAGLLLLAGSQLYAQQNPAAANPVLNPSPLNNIGSQFDISFDVGNSGTLDISGLNPTQKMSFTLSLGKCAPSVGGSISTIGTNALSGSALTYFDVTYDASSKIFTGVQKNSALGITPIGIHQLVVHLQVTALSTNASVNDVGASLNVQPNPASSGTQPTSDDNLSIFTHTIGSPLPVVLSTFTAKADGCSVVLDWSTGKEEAFDHFEVERSGDSKSYSRIAAVPATGDNSTYTYTDSKPLNGRNAYRLKMVDRDGSYQYSEVESGKAECAIDGGGLAVYPNPAHGTVYLKGVKAGSTIRLMDVTGRMVMERTNAATMETLDLSALPAALYTVQLVDNDAVTATVKLSKQ